MTRVGGSSGGSAKAYRTNGNPRAECKASDTARPCQTVNFDFRLICFPAMARQASRRTPLPRDALGLHRDLAEVQPLEHVGDIDEVLERGSAIGADQERGVRRQC